MKTQFDSLRVGNHEFQWGSRTYIMGILNVTPDSFSGDGLRSHDDGLEQSLRQAEHFLRHSADILDIGGESTRPGSQPVTAEEELERVIPVIHAIKKKFLKRSFRLTPAKPRWRKRRSKPARRS